LSSKLDRYRSHDYPIPERMLSWEVTGAGFENVGVDGRPVRVPVPGPGPSEVLCRVDAVGLCFSDVKMILAGNTHPRIRGRDLEADPTRGGHEASLTIVAVGEGEEADYRIGDRYLLQADVYYQGRTMAVGYVIPGAMAEYMIMPKEGLHGDAGSYLIPIARDGLGYAEAALVEPWACVEAAYRIAARTAPVAGGRALVVNASGGDSPPEGLPPDAEVVVLSSPTPDDIRAAGGNAGSADGLTQTTAEQAGFDDCVLVGSGSGAGADSKATIEACLSALKREGHLCILGAEELPRDVMVDIGRMHYHGIRVVAGASVEEAYRANAREDLLPGGAAHFSGAGGPMGQMHVQRAIEHDEPPAAVVVTDLAVDRLAHIEKLLGDVARERGVRLACLNPKDFADPAAFEEALFKAAGKDAFDDIVLCAPVAPLVTAAVAQAAPRGVVNVFAGLAIGKTAALDLDAIAKRNVRIVGSSGSALDDMKSVVRKVESGSLRTGRSLAAVGGLAQTLEGLVGMKEGRFPGKTVVFPGVADFALTPPAELAGRMPDVAKLLGRRGVWTKAAEEAFLEREIVLPEG
jgi:threonine dehydrogenase-like Zn-dependent dehydrogenase